MTPVRGVIQIFTFVICLRVASILFISSLKSINDVYYLSVLLKSLIMHQPAKISLVFCDHVEELHKRLFII